MSTFANSVKRTCAAVCPLYGEVPMGAPGPPGKKGLPGPPVSHPSLTGIKSGIVKHSGIILIMFEARNFRCGFIQTLQRHKLCLLAPLNAKRFPRKHNMLHTLGPSNIHVLFSQAHAALLAKGYNMEFEHSKFPRP